MRLLLVRLLQSVLTLFAASVVIFVLVRVVPGDPVTALSAEALPQAIIDQQRRLFGLDRPLPRQYVLWLSNAVHGEFGLSWTYSQPAFGVILQRFPATLQLAAVAFGAAVVLGMAAGLIAGMRRGTAVDYLLNSITVIGQGLPIFWLGIMLILVFAVSLRWLPTSGRHGPSSLILPSVTLVAWLLPAIARVTRASVVEALVMPYISTARAKGLDEGRVALRHALPNALLPVITLLGVQMGNLLSGAIITEAVFAWPGVGSLLVDAIRLRDYPVVQAAVLLSVSLYVTITLVVDLLYQRIDPRVRV
jgi:peptide/nickel transport system permease protein